MAIQATLDTAPNFSALVVCMIMKHIIKVPMYTPLDNAGNSDSRYKKKTKTPLELPLVHSLRRDMAPTIPMGVVII